MHNMIRSTWLRSILLFALVLSASNCGDESEVIILELNCPALEGFEGGTYLFTVDRVTDNPGGCSFGQADPFVGEQFGPLDLPATVDLPAQRTIEDVPLVGTVTVDIRTDGQTIRIDGTEQIQVSVPGIGNITATVTGLLCPKSASRVDGQITVRITSPIACNVTAWATGTPQ
jgi:hypothetical protein